jgi:hypothetical protein
MAIQARERFLAAKKRRKFVHYFGPALGQRVWQVAQIKPVRNAAKAVLNLGLFPRFRTLAPKDEVQAWE